MILCSEKEKRKKEKIKRIVSYIPDHTYNNHQIQRKTGFWLES